MRGGMRRSASVHRRFLSELPCVGVDSVDCACVILCRKLEVIEIAHIQGSFSNYAGQCVKFEVIGIGMSLIACVALVAVCRCRDRY